MSIWVILGPLVAILLTNTIGGISLWIVLWVAALWDRLLTLRCHPKVKAERVARMTELRHELIAADRAQGLVPREIAPHIAFRLFAGIVDDIRWRRAAAHRLPAKVAAQITSSDGAPPEYTYTRQNDGITWQIISHVVLTEEQLRNAATTFSRGRVQDEIAKMQEEGGGVIRLTFEQ